MKDMKTLMNEWRTYEQKLLKEDANPQAVDRDRFPLQLSKVSPKASKIITRSGQRDGQADDDTIDVGKGSYPVGQLKPSQSSMNIGKAMAQALAMIQGDMEIGGDLGAFISSDKHIMDGHHRWVATTMVDPSKNVGGYTVDFPGTELIAVLNAITKGRLGVQQGKKGSGGFNQFEAGPIKQTLQAYLKNGIKGKFPKTPEYVQQALEKFTRQQGPAALDAAVAKFVNNLKAVKPFTLPKGAPARPDMPVIDPDITPDAVKTAVQALEKGEVDINPPYAKTGRKFMDTGKGAQQDEEEA